MLFCGCTFFFLGDPEGSLRPSRHWGRKETHAGEFWSLPALRAGCPSTVRINMAKKKRRVVMEKQFLCSKRWADLKKPKQ